jgi:hypothetical protein
VSPSFGGWPAANARRSGRMVLYAQRTLVLAPELLGRATLPV